MLNGNYISLEIVMKNKRKYSRAKLEAQCSIVVSGGDVHPASLDDLSFGGALIEVKNNADLNVGEICDIELCLKTSEHPVKRAGKIVRRSSKKIGVSFIS
jgi:hypothetical protein